MSKQQEPITAYHASKSIEAQSQDLPGTDADMAPTAEHAKQECWDENGKPFLKEYQGSSKLENKKALITGGDSGLGRSVAVFFAREGADVSIVYLPEEQKECVFSNLAQRNITGPSAEWLKTHVESTTDRAINLIQADLEQSESAPKIVRSHMDKFGRLDILVNNASKQVMCKDIKALDVKQVEGTFKLNIISMIQMVKEAAPYLRRGSSIINTTSVTAHKVSPSLIDYSSTKGAIVSFTRSLAGQLAPKGIRVNAISPGPFYTPLQPASRPADDMENWEVGSIPLHDRAGQPAEIAEAYVLLAGPGGNYITGSVIHINGGQHMGGS